MSKRKVTSFASLLVLIASLLALLGPRPVEPPPPPEPKTPAAEVAEESMAEYRAQMAACYRAVATALEDGTITTDKALFDTLRTNTGTARQTAFQPLYDLTQKEIGRPSPDAPFDRRKAAELFTEFANGFDN